MQAIVAFLLVSVAHSLALPAACPLISDSLSFTSALANLTLPGNITSVVSTTTLSANSTASGVYAPGQIRTEICSIGSLFHFSSEEDVNEVIATATLDTLQHEENETMPKVAYHAGPGGGQGVILAVEPLRGTVNLTWGMWLSVIVEITRYYAREGKMPIDFYVTYITESRALLIAGGSLVHDLSGEGDER